MKWEKGIFQNSICAIDVKIIFFPYDRIKSVNEKGNICSIESRRTRSGTITDNYTELGLENVTTEPENQYESLARQENYKNLNMA